MKIKKIPATVYEIHWPLTSQGITDEIQDFLIRKKIKIEEICETILNGNRTASFYAKNAISAKKIVLAMKKEVSVKATLRILAKKEWQDVWKKGFKPFNLTSKIMVVPRWEMKTFPIPEHKFVIYIDTAMAFGTGLHETTQFMSNIIENNKLLLGNFLDIGTGTGILAMVAKLSGAKKVHAVDIAPDAVKTAKENLMVNKIKINSLRVFDIGLYSKTEQFDFVVANLITNDLLEHQEKIWRCVKVGGLCAVSGISLENLSRFKKNWKVHNTKKINELRGKQWAALLYRKELLN